MFSKQFNAPQALWEGSIIFTSSLQAWLQQEMVLFMVSQKVLPNLILFSLVSYSAIFFQALRSINVVVSY